MSAPRWTLGALAERFDLRLDGPADQVVTGVMTLARAQPQHLAFFANTRYREDLRATQAGVVVLAERDRADCAVSVLLARDPYLAYARIAQLFAAAPRPAGGIHPSAVIEAGASVHPDATIGPLCTVAAGARIEAGAVLGPHCVIGPDCVVGPDCELVARITLVKRVRLGARVLLHPGVVLGADGFGLARDRSGWTKVPQLGGVVVGDDCEIGANTTVDCGALDDTVLGADVRIDNQVQIGHNVVIGAHTAIAGCTGVAGSAEIGANCLIAGACGIGGHIRIADGTTVLGMSMVTHDIHTAGVYAGGPPVMDNASWRRNMARLRRLDDLARQVQRLHRSNPSAQGSSDD